VVFPFDPSNTTFKTKNVKSKTKLFISDYPDKSDQELLEIEEMYCGPAELKI